MISTKKTLLANKTRGDTAWCRNGAPNLAFCRSLQHYAWANWTPNYGMDVKGYGHWAICRNMLFSSLYSDIGHLFLPKTWWKKPFQTIITAAYTLGKHRSHQGENLFKVKHTKIAQTERKMMQQQGNSCTSSLFLEMQNVILLPWTNYILWKLPFKWKLWLKWHLTHDLMVRFMESSWKQHFLSSFKSWIQNWMFRYRDGIKTSG